MDKKYIRTFAPSEAKRHSSNNHSAKEVCQVAFYAAKRDQRPHNVGETYTGFEIGTFPKVMSQYIVYPNGEVWSSHNYRKDN